ncbi:MAG: methyltransferase domain-containing protein, partial [Woeseiaceae bacterium]|nr:methyltransferase domain-containing protein [Woeseiaceae bacterium]
DRLISDLSEFIGELSIRARLPQIEVAVAENALALVFRVLDPPNDNDLERFRRFGEQHDLQVWLQPGGLDSIHAVWPAANVAQLAYTLPDFDLRIEFAPTDFIQVNAEINRRMVASAIDYLDPGPGDRVLDLYCGIGNFSLALARCSEHVLGIEGEPSLVRRAEHNAAVNGLSNTRFRVADLSAIDGSEDWLNAHWDRVLLDPARSGAAELAGYMQKLGPERIVYVSCHPGTLARDAGVLVHEQGYRLDAAGIIDMFPHTAHVESVAVFSKNS